jgi:antirestriction protein
VSDLRAWVGCWACYNEGFLVGDWFDLAEGAPSMRDVHRRGLDSHDARADLEMHEEPGVFDLDGDLAWFTDAIGESLYSAVQVAEVVKGIAPERLAVFAAYAAYQGSEITAALAEEFDDAYIASYESVRDFGIDYCMDLIGWDSLPEETRQALGDYIDWAEVGEGYLHDYGSARIDSTLHVWHLT